MRIITVSGAYSGAGKTLVVERLLKIFKDWSALKVTLSHNGLCPTGRDCGICEKLTSQFSIISDKKIIKTQGKDTWRFKKAGAKKVLWLKAKPAGLKPGLKKAISMFSAECKKGAQGLIIEGTSVLKYLKPDLAILVRKENSVLKPSAQEVLKKIDLILTM
jgi:molybdopterin-guanine dinucleotide biosynthesis protein